MFFLIILTIWISLILLVIVLCFAARLGDLQRSDDPAPAGSASMARRSA